MTAGTTIKKCAPDTTREPTGPHLQAHAATYTTKDDRRSAHAAQSKIQADSVRYLGTTALRPNHPAVKALRRQGHQPSIHGTKVWRSSFVVMKYLKRNPDVPVLDQIKFWMLFGEVTCSANTGFMNYGSYHGGGSPIMEQIAITAQYNIKLRENLVKAMAGIEELKPGNLTNNG